MSRLRAHPTLFLKTSRLLRARPSGYSRREKTHAKSCVWRGDGSTGFPRGDSAPGGTRWWCHSRGGCCGHLLPDTVWEGHLGHTSHNVWTAQQQRLNQPPRSTVSRLRNPDFQSSCNTRIPAVPFPMSAVLGVLGAAASTADG